MKLFVGNGICVLSVHENWMVVHVVLQGITKEIFWFWNVFFIVGKINISEWDEWDTVQISSSKFRLTGSSNIFFCRLLIPRSLSSFQLLLYIHAVTYTWPFYFRGQCLEILQIQFFIASYIIIRCVVYRVFILYCNGAQDITLLEMKIEREKNVLSTLHWGIRDRICFFFSFFFFWCDTSWNGMESKRKSRRQI